MTKDIELAHQIIDETYKYNNYNYNQIFMWTTENIRGMINQIDLTNKNILTVCSSGDHIFNFLLENSNKIVAFDINNLTEYIFYLKRAAIINLEYEEFLDFFFKKKFFFGKTFNIHTYQKIRENIPTGRILDFWDNLFSTYSAKQLYNSKLFMRKHINNQTIIICNKYLNNKKNYNYLKIKLKKLEKLEFYNINIFETIPPTREKFDFVYLSNILDNCEVKDKINYLKKIKELTLKISTMIKEEGLIGICYLYCYLDDYWINKSENNTNIQTLLANKELQIDNCKVIDFKSCLNLNSVRHIDRDGVILYKKKTKNQKNN